MKAKKMMKRLLSVVLVIVMAFGNYTYNFSHSDNAYVVEAAQGYGLCANIQDGVILHCFDWKYNDIKAELPNIAAAGFTSVQTSPAQQGVNSGTWYWLYQPLGFYIGNNDLGTKAELQSLCTEADKYGIKVIVDVVANHLAGDHTNIQADLKPSQYWHNYGSSIDYLNRYQITHGDIGMPDINTEDSYVQQCVRNYVNELKSIGVDGIRWDAGKHIGLPSEGCNFWSDVVANNGLWNYAEILKGPTDALSGNESLMQEYTNYVSVTDSNYGKAIREAFNNGTVPTAYANWTARGVATNKMVYWAESHDTWSNNKDEAYSNEMSQNVIDRAYAIAASREGASALYLSRPASNIKDNIIAGQKGSTHFTSKEVAAVNHFHNAMVGQKEYYATGDNCAVVAREKGAVIVKGSGSGYVSVPNGGSTTEPGTYTDEITGNIWTVTSTTISGTIGSTGIAVIYDADNVTTTPSATISVNGGEFYTDTFTFTIGLSNAVSGTYKIGNQSETTYTSSTNITIGSDMNYGDSVTITLKATDGTTTSTPVTYTFTKVEKIVNKAYISLPSGWSEPVYCYAYNDSGTTNATWPGVQMTKDASTGYYVYEIPESIEQPRVIFYSSTTNRYPADMEPGLLLETTGSWIYIDGVWKKYTSEQTTTPETTTVAQETTTQGSNIGELEPGSGDVVMSGFVGTYSWGTDYLYQGEKYVSGANTSYKYLVIRYTGDISSMRLERGPLQTSEVVWFAQNEQGSFVTIDGSIVPQTGNATTVVVDLAASGITADFFNDFHVHTGATGSAGTVTIENAWLTSTLPVIQETTTEAPTTAEPETTTEIPTTEEITTADTSKEPIEVIGEVVSSPQPGIINVVWGQNDAQINLGQKYNVYVDGTIAYDVNGNRLENVICAAVDIPVSGGEHTVRITAVLEGKETTGVSKTLTVESTVVETTTIPETTTEEPTTEEPTTEEPTTAAPKTYSVILDGAVVATVEEGSTYTFPKTAKVGYYGDGKLYKKGSAYTVTKNAVFYTVGITAGKGASIKWSEPSGMRFSASLTCSDTTFYDASVIKTGMLIAPYDFYSEDGNLDFTSEYIFLNVENSGWTGTTGAFGGALASISSDNYKRMFVARAYVTVEYADGTESTVYSNMSGSRSVGGVAETMLNTESIYSNLSTAQKTLLEKYIQ